MTAGRTAMDSGSGAGMTTGGTAMAFGSGTGMAGVGSDCEKNHILFQ